MIDVQESNRFRCRIISDKRRIFETSATETYQIVYEIMIEVQKTVKA